jgi:hypothetical protein
VLYSISAQAQIAFLGRYNKAVYIEGFGTGPFFTVGMDKMFKKDPKSFYNARIGVGVIFDSSFGLKNTDFTLPVSLTKAVIINNLKKRVKYRVSLKCNAQPPKYASEWFLEGGLGYTPSFYSKTDVRHRIYGIISLRQSFTINRPPKPLVYYLKLQYNPFFYFPSFYINRKEHFQYVPSSEHVVTGLSIGKSF